MEKVIKNPIGTKGGKMERKEFMKQVGLSFGAIMLMNCLQSCSEGDIPDPNPTGGSGGTSGGLDISLDLNTADYKALQTKGAL